MYNKQLGIGYVFIKLDTLNDLLLSQPDLFAKKRNEKDWARMIHPPYSVAHADLQINLICLKPFRCRAYNYILTSHLRGGGGGGGGF